MYNNNQWAECDEIAAQLKQRITATKHSSAEQARITKLRNLRRHPYIAARLEVSRLIGLYGVDGVAKEMLDNVKALEKIKANQKVWAEFKKLGGM